MGFQTFEQFDRDKHARIPLWLELLARVFGRRVGYHESLLCYEWRGTMYIVK